MRRLLAMLAPVVLLVGCGGSSGVTHDVNAVIGMVERGELTAGAANLQQWFQAHGTYAGADSGVTAVTVVRADSETWCLQSANAHEDGPNGTPAPGPCP